MSHSKQQLLDVKILARYNAIILRYNKNVVKKTKQWKCTLNITIIPFTYASHMHVCSSKKLVANHNYNYDNIINKQTI